MFAQPSNDLAGHKRGKAASGRAQIEITCSQFPDRVEKSLVINLPAGSRCRVPPQTQPSRNRRAVPAPGSRQAAPLRCVPTAAGLPPSCYPPEQPPRTLPWRQKSKLSLYWEIWSGDHAILRLSFSASAKPSGNCGLVNIKTTSQGLELNEGGLNQADSEFQLFHPDPWVW
ncbi:uncharacterized protein LOC121825341 [Peromyscus maniculatus bairdii]|uniref:uncharacterized protein LOC121825341 n=1 Tax=Peromyscus maniculatus bairdii TaxID=230844 RepID=UPI003FD0A83B